MSETTVASTRAQLVALAQENPVPGAKELLTAIEEAYGQLKFAGTQISLRAHLAAEHVAAESYQVAGSFMKEANDYDIAAAKLNTLMLTLACVLQNAGISVEY